MRNFFIDDRLEQVDFLREQKLDLSNFKKMLAFLKDKNELIRIEAVESLYLYKKYLQKKHFKHLLRDRSSLVRSYAVVLFSLFPDSISEVLRYLRTQRSSIVKIGIYTALYEMGEKQYLQEIVNLLFKSRQYRVRIACVETLNSFIDKNNCRLILDIFLKAAKTEKIKSVLHSLRLKIKSLST